LLLQIARREVHPQLLDHSCQSLEHSYTDHSADSNSSNYCNDYSTNCCPLIALVDFGLPLEDFASWQDLKVEKKLK
jgi:hypothetical protein